MSTIAERAKKLRKELKLTQMEVAEKASLGQASYAEIESGKISYPRKIKELSEALQTTPQYLLFGENEVMAKRHKIPLIAFDMISKWRRGELKTNDIESVYIDEEMPSGCFAVQMSGFSMYNPQNPKSIDDGALIIVDTSRAAANNDIVIATSGDSQDATIKLLAIEGSNKILIPLNPQFPSLQVDDSCNIIGVAIMAISKKWL
jgi:SOS-response transcriptional repressor LexA